MRRLQPYVLLTGLSLPFLHKPVHIDDTNFLALARQAVVDVWRPHAADINWLGKTERAFDVLSNPPGIAWWLAPVADAPVWMQHLWMLPWLWLATWGALRLGRMLTGTAAPAALLILGSPVAMLATQSLTPDLPLLACVLAGMAGVLAPVPEKGASSRWPWALLVGMAGLFRYSGAVLIPVVALWPWLHGDRRGAGRLGMAGAAPLVLLMVHDFHAYGQAHLLAMIGFQGVSNTGVDLIHKAAASVAMLGGAVVLPVLCWAQPRRALVGMMVGAGLGCTAIHLLGISGTPAIAGLLATAAGGASLGGSIRTDSPTDKLLLCWLGLGLCFLLSLRFAATRYWLPFMAPAVLLCLRSAPRRLVQAGVGLSCVLGLSLSVDDLELARAQERTAAEAQALGTGMFAGHWGFQHHLEQAGWSAIEDEAAVPAGVLFAMSMTAWPQEPSGCRSHIDQFVVRDRWPGPRVYTKRGGANIHGHFIYAKTPHPTLAPWSLGSDILDRVRLYRGCPD